MSVMMLMTITDNLAVGKHCRKLITPICYAKSVYSISQIQLG